MTSISSQNSLVSNRASEEKYQVIQLSQVDIQGPHSLRIRDSLGKTHDFHYTRNLDPACQMVDPYDVPSRPMLEGGFGSANASYDQNLMTRLSNFICSPIPSVQSLSGLWLNLAAGHAEIVELLAKKEFLQAHDYLNNMHQKSIMHGISTNHGDYEFMMKNSEIRHHVCVKAYDILLGLNEYFGRIPTQNPEQGIGNLVTPVDILADMIDFPFPKWQGNYYGLKTSRGILPDRSLFGLYAALKINHLNFDKDPADYKVCEIGGGAGYTLYWLYQNGYKQLYSVELPTIILAQAFQLAQNIGSEKICLPNEIPTAQTVVRFLTPEQFNSGMITNLDCVINMDSMPEMSQDMVSHYLQTISQVSSSFLSINHEAKSVYVTINGPADQINVAHTILSYPDFRQKFRRHIRNQCWVRRGYVEDFYQIAQKTDKFVLTRR